MNSREIKTGFMQGKETGNSYKKRKKGFSSEKD